MRFASTFWKEVMASVAKARGGFKGRRAGSASPADSDDIREICRTLLRTRGEASVVTLARGALDVFGRLDDGGRREFFRFLAHELGPEPAALERAVEAYREAPGPEAAAALARATEPPRRELLAAPHQGRARTVHLVAAVRGLRAMVEDGVDGRRAGLPDRAAVEGELVRPDRDTVGVLVVVRHLVGEHQGRGARAALVLACSGVPPMSSASCGWLPVVLTSTVSVNVTVARTASPMA